MNKLEAENLVTKTFTQPFDEARFRHFARNLFHDCAELDEKSLSGQYIREAFRSGVKSYKRLFKFEDPEKMTVDVLAIKLTNAKTLDQARTMQRNFVAWYLNGSRGGKLKDAALVAFYSDDSPEWRFSLVRMDYVIGDKGRIKKELTPAKRFSFLVGGIEKTHTARKQLLPILQNEQETTLGDLETAFNIESVTKEFFEQYKRLYLRLKDSLEKHIKIDPVSRTEFEKKGIKPDEFSKHLLGQIVFLYFLQRKGWLGVEKGGAWGTGPKDFLRQLFEKKFTSYNNFFNDVLELLFYDALAVERYTADHFYPQLNCKIPFLNGGLFEPFKGYDWDQTDILLDNGIFKDILDVFDLYNFTVREDEPLDKEVAVDPEMLGKVFENLIPENERKGSGTYYTPREIVHYMCQESLINYLDARLNINRRAKDPKKQKEIFSENIEKDLLTKEQDVYLNRVPRKDIEEFIYRSEVTQEHDAIALEKEKSEGYSGEYLAKLPKSVQEFAVEIDQALSDIKICDPAIGSGAFPVGMMTEIVRARMTLEISKLGKSLTPYEIKRHAIQESIYGVDIEPSAVDIAKLRLWLSLVVDEQEFDGIQPLPNLEYKIMVGDSLISVEKTLFNLDLFNEIESLKAKYFSETSPSKKSYLKEKIEVLVEALVEDKKLFDFKIFFSEVFSQNSGFDVILANPPYLESRSNEFSLEAKKAYQKALKTEWKDQSTLIPRGSDLLVYFYPKAIELINPLGSVCFITENSWLDTNYGHKLQRFLLKNTSFWVLLDSKFRYFSGKDAPNINTIISVFGRKENLISEKEVRFVHTDDNLGRVRESFSGKKPTLENENISLKKYDHRDKNLENFKWGFLYRIPEWFLEPFKETSSQESDEKQLIFFGQGLNLSAEYVLTIKGAKEIGLKKENLMPFIRKENSYSFRQPTFFLINSETLSKEQKTIVRNNGFQAFQRNSTRKVPAAFLMPRGIGRHFCGFNEINAFSSSYVEIYEKTGLSKEQKLSLWAYCNSSYFWLLRELSGRTNLGGGMLKSEATDVATFPYPFKKIENNVSAIESNYKAHLSDEPLQTIEEISTKRHKELDRIVFESLGILDFIDQIQNELIARINYRQEKSTT